MNLENYYWYFQSAIPHRIVDQIMKFGLSQQEQIATTGDVRDKVLKNEKLTDEDIKNVQKTRNSNVVWLSEDWIYKEIHPFLVSANKNADWNYEWDFSEACQFTKYGVDQHYGWHCDSWSKPYGDEEPNLNLKGKVRKLSMTISLSDPSEYEGGNLEFDFRNYSKPDDEKDRLSRIKECVEIRPKGSVVIFPSYVYHRVKPVTKGTRYSLVCWSVGKPFR
jgi:PKHD-type hydroxylase